jgi:formylglycine-generating enzyme required for sulfatase activity
MTLRRLAAVLLLAAPAAAQEAGPPTADPVVAQAAAQRGAPVAEREFRDCDVCPLMVAVPGGSFALGPPGEDEPLADDSLSTLDAAARRRREREAEGPPRTITIPALAVGKFRVTKGEWGACVEDGACIAVWPPDERLDEPRDAVSWVDAETYVQWLSEKTGRTYRLLADEEWEHAARAGSTRSFSRCEPTPERTNAFGLVDMSRTDGFEWVEGCAGASPQDAGVCMRSAPWDYGSGRRTSACRRLNDDAIRYDYVGFRVAREL